MRLRPKQPRGFTLIELMLVVTMISILTSIAIPNFQAIAIRAKGAERKTIMNGIAQAVFERIAHTGTLPNDLGGGVSSIAAAVNPAPPYTGNLSPFDMTLANLSDWKYLDFRPDGYVRFSYSVSGTLDSINGTGTISVNALTDLNSNNVVVTYTINYVLGANGLWTPSDEQQVPAGET